MPVRWMVLYSTSSGVLASRRTSEPLITVIMTVTAGLLQWFSLCISTMSSPVVLYVVVTNTSYRTWDYSQWQHDRVSPKPLVSYNGQEMRFTPRVVGLPRSSIAARIRRHCNLSRANAAPCARALWLVGVKLTTACRHSVCYAVMSSVTNSHHTRKMHNASRVI